MIKEWSDDAVDDLAVFGERIDVLPLFERDRAGLLDLLSELTAEQWALSTAAGPWRVRDVVAHMLGDDLNRLSRTRDDHVGTGPGTDETLADFVNRINDEWVRATARISPEALVSLLQTTSTQVLGMWRALDPDALGDPVSWAGPSPAPMWLDCARDFTEYWVHKQQIRDAVGLADTTDRDILGAVLDVFLRAVPRTVSHHDSAEGSTLAVAVSGATDRLWSWTRVSSRWRPSAPSADADTLVEIEADTLWRLCVRMVEPSEARRRTVIFGDESLASALLEIVSVIR